MHTQLHPEWRDSQDAQEAASILGRCVHCGFCNAVCPTYRLLGDELDGPRGRIYLIRQLLESGQAGADTRRHLDRCLVCRACEPACPSGVRYGRLLELGRARLQSPPTLLRRLATRLLCYNVPWPHRLQRLLRLGQWLRPVLPAALRRQVPRVRDAGPIPAPRHVRRLLLPEGCAQSILAPTTNAAAVRVLDGLGISAEPIQSGCCGALSLHLGRVEEAQAHARRFMDACMPGLATAEGLAMSASGCGVTVRAYATLLRDDPDYAEAAAQLAQQTRDLSEWVDGTQLRRRPRGRVACQIPCTLQHAQGLGGRVESLLQAAGWQLVPCADAGQCCGAAGSYFVLQPGLAGQLLEHKLQSLQAGAPDYIATANIGCQLWLGSQARIPIRHWVELLEP